MIEYNQIHQNAGAIFVKLSDIRKQIRELPSMARASAEPSVSDGIRALARRNADFYLELEMDSQFADAFQDISYSDASIPLHSHPFYELIYCRCAGGAECLVGTERYQLRQGDVLFIPPGVSHHPILPSSMPEPYIRDVLWISQEFLCAAHESYMDVSEKSPPPIPLLRTAGTSWEYIGSLFRGGVMEAENRQSDWQAAVIANALLILTHLRRASRDAHRMSPRAEKPELLDQVLAYVEQHLSERITLSEVARHFFISESTVTQIFRKKMGISFYRCVTRWRLIAAKALIEENTPLIAVAEQVGFSDYSSFFRAFKQEYGTSPKQYRKTRGLPTETE